MVAYYDYKQSILTALKDGTERSLYKPLCNFIEKFVKNEIEMNITTISEQSSKNYEKGVGFPDVAIKSKDFTLGYIELKLPKDDLNDKKFKEQFYRYKASLDNIIFTNLKVWQLFQWDNEGNSILIKEIKFDSLTFEEISNDFTELFKSFLSYTIIQAKTAKQLAINLAKKTKLLASLLTDILEDDERNEELKNTKKGFESTLLNSIDEKSFTNLIAETFTYSLFIAKLEHFEKGKVDELTLNSAMDFIPVTIPVLQDLYQLANSLSRKTNDIKEIVEIILKELNYCDIKAIRNSFYSQEGLNEPILYFYETFLNEYDKETKKKRGAYYTPKPIVDFIVKNVDMFLIEKFNLNEGFLNPKVKLLDPATGTGTFTASVIETVKTKLDKKYKIINSEKEEFTKEVINHILKNFYGFELMIAPYTIAHLKLTLLLKSFGFKFKTTSNTVENRLKIYLANTLDDPDKIPNNLFGFSFITDESKKANEVKNQKDIIAIIGNPPYSGSSQNPSYDKITKNLTWIGKQIEYYKYNGNIKLAERNPKWLQDDYVKFIRFAQYQIESKGNGIIGYIVPHGFLDNPTFRYMRKSLLSTFTTIYILDLHGNIKKKEKTPDGKKDENVFDIEQGVCIAIFIKELNKTDCEVFHGDIFGERVDKFNLLNINDIKTLCTTKINPSGEMSYFIPFTPDELYEKFWSVKEIFEVNSVGIVTGKDKLYINDNKNDLIKNISAVNKTVNENYINKISYRPFDDKYIYYDVKAIERARAEVMQHILKENVGLMTSRQIKSSDFHHIFIADKISESCLVSNKTSEIGYLFPLYVYNKNLFEKTANNEFIKTTNFTKGFTDFKKDKLSNFTDEQIFYYIYGLLYSNVYRTKYNEFLKTDFPRIDFGFDIETISALGEKLAKLHLLTDDIFDDREKWCLELKRTKEETDFIVDYSKKGDVFKDNKIYINKDVYITEIAEDVYNFTIGGYQVLEKWLCDRKGTKLESDDLIHYFKIIISLRETIKIMDEIDEYLV